MASRPETGSRRLEDAVLRCVRERGADWFPDAGPVAAPRCRLLADRPRAALYAVHLDREAREPRVLVKVRRDGRPTGRDRPSLVGPGAAPSAREQTVLEHTALAELHALFGRAGSGFGSVRPLALLAEHGTLLLEYVPAPTLRAALAASGRLGRIRRRPPGTSLAAGLERAGAWLRAFQEAATPQGRLPRQADRTDVAGLFDEFGEFLARRLDRPAIADLTDRGAALAGSVLPERPALVPGHGDFAPRNVFVRGRDKVAVFDPLPRWLVPRYEDLARFLVALRLPGSQVHTLGLAYGEEDLQRMEAAVLRGYGVQEADLAALRCYQVLITVDRWSALLGPPAPPGDWRRRVAGTPIELATGLLLREVQRLLQLAEG